MIRFYVALLVLSLSVACQSEVSTTEKKQASDSSKVSSQSADGKDSQDKSGRFYIDGNGLGILELNLWNGAQDQEGSDVPVPASSGWALAGEYAELNCTFEQAGMKLVALNYQVSLSQGGTEVYNSEEQAMAQTDCTKIELKLHLLEVGKDYCFDLKFTGRFKNSGSMEIAKLSNEVCMSVAEENADINVTLDVVANGTASMSNLSSNLGQLNFSADLQAPYDYQAPLRIEILKNGAAHANDIVEPFQFNQGSNRIDRSDFPQINGGTLSAPGDYSITISTEMPNGDVLTASGSLNVPEPPANCSYTNPQNATFTLSHGQTNTYQCTNLDSDAYASGTFQAKCNDGAFVNPSDGGALDLSACVAK